MSWWQATWVGPTVGLVGSLALILMAALTITRQTPSDALFSRYAGSMVEARAFLGATLVLAGLCGFFLALQDLLNR